MAFIPATSFYQPLYCQSSFLGFYMQVLCSSACIYRACSDSAGYIQCSQGFTGGGPWGPGVLIPPEPGSELFTTHAPLPRGTSYFVLSLRPLGKSKWLPLCHGSDWGLSQAPPASCGSVANSHHFVATLAIFSVFHQAPAAGITTGMEVPAITYE